MRINTSISHIASHFPKVRENQAQHRQAEAAKGYERGAAGAPVIDAEYVDLAGTNSLNYQRELSDLDASLITQEPSTTPPGAGAQRTLQAKFRTAEEDYPPPGTYLNIFA